MFICSEHTRSALNIFQLPKVGVVTLRNFINNNRYISKENIYNSFCELNKISNNIETHFNKSDIIIDECIKYDIGILSLFDDNYPKELRNIPDPPPILYIKGNINIINNISIAVVGTRKPSNYGKEVAYRISKSLAANNITVVSGLALGIDTQAHKGAIDANGTTIAILAHGLDIVAPTSNTELAESIINNNGMLISEHPPKTPPRPPEFVRRNRIQSGMSYASIIVESGKEGGSIHQARFTINQNRKLCVVMPDNSNNNTIAQDFTKDGALYLINEYNAIILKNSNDLNLLLNDINLPKNNTNTQLNFQW